MLLLSVQRSAILKRTPKGSIRLSRTGYPGQVARPVHQRAVYPYRKMPQNKVPKAFEKSAKKPAKELAPGQTTLSPKRDVAAHAMIDVATDGTTSSTAPLSAMKKPTGTRTSSPFKICGSPPTTRGGSCQDVALSAKAPSAIGDSLDGDS